MKQRPAALRGRVLGWYRRSGRDLPWRRTNDPYRILVSEVMLQQTQVARVREAYARFLRRFPTLRALARASLGDVLREWSGLGYNRRARDLHRIARQVRALPRTAAELDALPGIGRYTAGAVACFAHGAVEPFADTNIRRVLGRVLLGRTASESEARELDRTLIARRAPAAWHHALMDIGATFCKSRPRCAACPLRAMCAYTGSEPERPRRQAPFGSSDRRIRGAIVRALAAAPAGLSLSAIREAVPDERVPHLVGALVADGLVTRRAGRVLLPD